MVDGTTVSVKHGDADSPAPSDDPISFVADLRITIIPRHPTAPIARIPMMFGESMKFENIGSKGLYSLEMDPSDRDDRRVITNRGTYQGDISKSTTHLPKDGIQLIAESTNGHLQKNIMVPPRSWLIFSVDEAKERFAMGSGESQGDEVTMTIGTITGVVGSESNVHEDETLFKFMKGSR